VPVDAFLRFPQIYQARTAKKRAASDDGCSFPECFSRHRDDRDVSQNRQDLSQAPLRESKFSGRHNLFLLYYLDYPLLHALGFSPVSFWIPAPWK